MLAPVHLYGIVVSKKKKGHQRNSSKTEKKAQLAKHYNLGGGVVKYCMQSMPNMNGSQLQYSALPCQPHWLRRARTLNVECLDFTVQVLGTWNM